MAIRFSSYNLFCKRSFMRCKKGITTIEFALISPVMMLMMMGVIEFSIVMFTQALMESATTNTARMGKTGYSESGSTREEQLIANVANRTGGLLDPADISVSMKIYPSFDNVDDPEPYIDENNNGFYNSGEPYTDINGNGQWDEDMGTAGAGSANDIVVYTVSYPWHITTPIVSAITGEIFTISARSVVKNEPW